MGFKGVLGGEYNFNRTEASIWKGLEGELVDMNGKSKVAVRLTMLGCACVDIPAGCGYD